MPRLGLGAARKRNVVGGGVATIMLSSNAIAENAAAGANVGTLSVVGGSGTYTFSLTDTAGNRFAVDGAALERGATALDYETATSHSVTVTADNGVDPVITRTITIQVLPAAPVLTWVSDDTAYDPEITVALSNPAVDDVIELQIDDNPDFASLFDTDTNTLDAGEVAANEATFGGISTLSAGVHYYMRARVTRNGATSEWSNTVDKLMYSWTPAELSTALLGWYDASDAASVVLSGASITQWNDKSGSARHLVQATSTAQPTYQNSAEPFYVSFDGTSDFLSAALAKSAYPLTLVAVLRNNNPAFGAVLTHGSTGSIYKAMTVGSGSLTATDRGAGNNIATFAAANGVDRLVIASFDGVNATIEVGDATPVSVATANTYFAGGTLFVGKLRTTADSFFLGRGYEFLVIDRLLTAAEKADLKAYVLAKWGV